MTTPYWSLAGYNSIRDAIDDRYYRTKIAYLRVSKGLLTDVQVKHLENYREDSQRLATEFQEDALHEVGISPLHSKAGVLWNLAWEHGHASGESDVLGYLSEFSELLK